MQRDFKSGRRIGCVLAALFTATLAASGAAVAAQGIVVYNQSGCGDRFVVSSNQGFAILEWYGGKDPPEGTVLVGDFESYGMKDVYDRRGGSTRVWVEDFWLSQGRVMEEMRKFCRR